MTEPWRVKPLHSYLLLKPIDPPRTTASGLVVVQQPRTRYAAVDYVPPNDPDIGTNMVVIFNPWSGIPLDDGSRRVLVRREDIIAVVDQALEDPEEWDLTQEEVLR